jgi:hypothetical protein
VTGEGLAALLLLIPNLPGEQMTIFGFRASTVILAICRFAPGGGKSGLHTVAIAESK